MTPESCDACGLVLLGKEKYVTIKNRTIQYRYHLGCASLVDWQIWLGELCPKCDYTNEYCTCEPSNLFANVVRHLREREDARFKQQMQPFNGTVEPTTKETTDENVPNLEPVRELPTPSA